MSAIIILIENKIEKRPNIPESQKNCTTKSFANQIFYKPLILLNFTFSYFQTLQNFVEKYNAQLYYTSFLVHNRNFFETIFSDGEANSRIFLQGTLCSQIVHPGFVPEGRTEANCASQIFRYFSSKNNRF